MEKDDIWSQITRKIAGEETSEDTESIDQWLKSKPTNKHLYERLSEVWNFREISRNNNNSLWDSVWRRIVVHDNRPKPFFYTTTLFKVAAVLIFILLSNFLVYTYRLDLRLNETSYQEIVVPRGNRMKIVLPDSTSIWLNNETKLRYASNFSSGNREVELSGEAYFDVHHDVKNPFIVKIGNQHIKVLGTRFSVNAYPEDRIIETSLISGSVIFESDKKINGESEFRLKPGNSLYYDKNNNSITTQKIQSSFYQYWENGVYVFTDEKFENLSIKIKRIFNVELVFQDDFLKHKTYTGTININDNIFTFMEAIRRTSAEPIEYKFNKNKIFIKLKTESKIMN